MIIKEFYIKFLQDFYGIKKGETVTFYNGKLRYPDGKYSAKYKGAQDFIRKNLSLNVEEVAHP